MKTFLTPIVALAIAAMTLAAGQSQAAQPTVRQACMSDFQKICAGTALTRGAVQRCVKGKEDSVSVECKSAMSNALKAREARKAAKSAGH